VNLVDLVKFENLDTIGACYQRSTYYLMDSFSHSLFWPISSDTLHSALRDCSKSNWGNENKWSRSKNL